MRVERGGPTTWAQQEWFADVGADEDTPWAAAANISNVFSGYRLPLGVVAAALRDVLARHEGLRTLMPRTPEGLREQRVCAVDDGLGAVIRMAAEGDEADGAMAESARTPFRLGEQWPVRFVLACEGGAVHRIGVVLDHAAVDAWGMKVLNADLVAALMARRAGREPYGSDSVVEQPLDTALWESGPEGARHAERAERHWRGLLESVRGELDAARPQLPGSAPAGSNGPSASSIPTLHNDWLASGKAAAAAEAIAAATGFRPSTCYLLAFGLAVAAVEGTPAVGLYALTANRLAPGAQRSVRKAIMPAPVLVRGGARDAFTRQLPDLTAQQMNGHRFANLDPVRAAALSAEILGDLQGTGAVSGRFNYIDDSVVGSAVNTRSLGVELIPFTDPAVQGKVVFDPPRPGGSRYLLNVQHNPGGALMTLACHEDTAWSPVTESILWHIEDLLVWAAAGAAGPPPEFGRPR